MDLRTRIQCEIVARQLAVSSAFEAIKKTEREAQREKRKVPRQEMEKLQGELKFRKALLESAYVSFEAVNRFPPVSR